MHDCYKHSTTKLFVPFDVCKPVAEYVFHIIYSSFFPHKANIRHDRESFLTVFELALPMCSKDQHSAELGIEFVPV